MLTKELFDQLLAVLSPEMDDARRRKAIIQNALVNSAVLRKIVWEGDELTFTRALIFELDKFGKLASGKLALVALLETLHDDLSPEQQQQCQRLIAQLTIVTAPPGPAIPAPSKTFESDELYVFISYATPDQASAQASKAFLNAAGIRVFFAPESIGPGDNWIASIEHALRQCQAMVLLLSPHSMPERKEVEREWNYFDLNRKPIYPLYLQKCEKHSRLVALNHIDAQTDLAGALEKLLHKLRQDFGARAAKTESAKPSAEEKDADTDPAPDPLTAYRRARIAEWSQPRYELDHRFVNLTLTLDRPEDAQQRYHLVEAPPMKDLREVLEKAKDHQALVLIGAPGSGKSTLLRRLQLDHSQDGLKDGGGQISFFVALNEHKGHESPRAWLANIWAERYPALPNLENLLADGRMLLLLDALNEMQPRQGTYAELIAEWKDFVQQATRAGNRLVFSCRSRDIGAAQLGNKDLPVPLIDVQPMTADQMQEFLQAYAPEHHERIWAELPGSKQFDLFQTPYFLKLLCEQVGPAGDIPKGRAGLFTGFVRRVLDREKDGQLFQPGNLLSARDRQKMASGKDWRDAFDLPTNGKLIPKLSQLAFGMQKDGSEVSLDYDDACRLLADEHAEQILAEQILKAGVEASLLDEARDKIKFFHQSLQEYFAARLLAKAPNPALVHVEWQADNVAEPLAETLSKLADGDPLPPLPQTGWEETTLTAAPMANDPAAFIRQLLPHNLPLAARCAAAPEVTVNEDLKQEIRRQLIERTQNMKADLRARIAAGEALGLIGDPRFERRKGEFGDYLLPPLVTIPSGKYTIGVNKSDYDDEKPAGEVQLDEFQIGQFPVTNAEYKLFMEAGGYEDERWWDTPESQAWRSGEASSEGAKDSWRETRKLLQDNWSEESIRAQVNWTSEQKEQLIEIRDETDEEFEARIEEWYPTGKLYRQPGYWDDARFNNPAQPVVGVTWFEARAYCNWLTANAANGLIYRLPTEAEFEAAARGKEGRQFPYGKKFDSAKCNTFESHIRRTTPVGVFDNATPEGAFDLSGNAYTWTLSIYDQERFKYPYQTDDGRQELTATGVNRVLRGGSWLDLQVDARAVFRFNDHPGVRDYFIGFRVVSCRPPSS